MLRRFELVTNSGIFEDFRWDISIPDFERINLIYGPNGSGKTSLSRALDSLGNEREGFANVSIRMSEVDKTNERLSAQAHDDEFERVFVFSEDYAARNHDFGGDAEVEAVLTLGERTVEDEKRIERLNELIDETKEELNQSSMAAHDADKALDDAYTSISRNVVDALSRAGGEYRSLSSYSKGTVKARFSASHADWVLMSKEERELALATVNSDLRQSVKVKSYSLSVRGKLIGDVAAVLSASPVSVLLDTLKEHQEASRWVEEGRHIHKALDVCIFCGGELAESRKMQIEKHFSDEVEEVQRKTEMLILEVKALQSALQTLLGDGAVSGSLFDDLRESFNFAHASAKEQEIELANWLKGLLEALEKKIANVVALVEYVVSDPTDVDGTQIEKALNDHNDRVSKHASLVQSAAKGFELHLLKESEDKVSALSVAAEKAEKTKADIEDLLQKQREELAALENFEGDPLPSAQVLTKELARILGRSELSFEPLSDSKHYRVTRFGKPARDLSTGERTAITLIHFLEKVKTSTVRSGKAIVVIDDPVSSLDSGASMGISTYIWSEVVSKDHIEQIFLLTHNFELFRQWDNQIEGLSRSRGALNKKFPSNCYELSSSHQEVGGVMKRVPTFTVWPPNQNTRLKLNSAYHHAFVTVVRAYQSLASNSSMEAKLDAFLLYPNVLRRILETFLAFKNPTSVGNFTGSMNASGKILEEFDYKGDSDALRLQLTRFTHAYSHAESPETDVTVSPEEIGTVIAAVFTFMNAVDRRHFEGLCEVIGVQAEDLLIEAQPVVDLTEATNGG
jgi:wobble nucleotide-excising tRNase